MKTKKLITIDNGGQYEFRQRWNVLIVSNEEEFAKIKKIFQEFKEKLSELIKKGVFDEYDYEIEHLPFEIPLPFFIKEEMLEDTYFAVDLLEFDINMEDVPLFINEFTGEKVLEWEIGLDAEVIARPKKDLAYKIFRQVRYTLMKVDGQKPNCDIKFFHADTLDECKDEAERWYLEKMSIDKEGI